MTFEGSLRKAARAADDAVSDALEQYRAGYIREEEPLTGAVVQSLRDKLQGVIEGLVWRAAVLKSRGKEESVIGADIAIHISLTTSERRYSKGVLVQAKRVGSGRSMRASEHSDLVDQCEKMLAVTPASFVWDYGPDQMRCGSASRIVGMTTLDLHNECTWTSYRFFYEFSRSPIGDPRIKGARFEELPVPNLLTLTAVGEEAGLFRF